jgi:hypothetical protein
MVGGNVLAASGLVEVGWERAQGIAMGQQLQTLPSGKWRSGGGERAWLSMLIDAMEEVSRCKSPCDRSVLAAFHAQLSRPAAPWAHHGSHFSLRN